MRKHLPPKDFLIGKRMPGFENHEIKELIGSGANGRVFRGHEYSTDSSLAFKVIPFENLSVNEESFLTEARKSNQIDHQSVLKCITAFKYSEKKVHTLILVYKYVNGNNLRDYVRKSPDNINIPFIEDFLETMLELLHELDGRGFPHGDLHAGNILIAKSKYSIDNHINFYVTDFGLQQLNQQTNDQNDYLSIAETLKLLLEKIKYQDCEGRDRFVFDILRNDFLDRHLIETDTCADPLACNPREMLQKLKGMDDEYRTAGRDPTAPKLVTPFDYPSCEQMGNSHLLLKNLYSDRLLGLSEIYARSNLVLTGPRGCGKTTVFRALSLEYLISVNDDNPKTVRYIGVYYRCDDLYFAFPRYKKPVRSDALDIPMHFLIVTLLSTALQNLSVWARRNFKKEFEDKEEKLTSDLWNILSITPPGSPGENRLDALVDKLKKERRRATKKQQIVHVRGEIIKNYFEPGVIISACKHIRNNLSFLEDRPFYFFIDDYSDPKITTELQKNLNRLVMYRSSDIFFKLSTESPMSFAQEDVDGKKFVETREYDLLNLGLRYLTARPGQGYSFLTDLFKRRFHEVNKYPVHTLEELLGTIPRNENAVARAFNKKTKNKDLRYYAGCEALVAMCSGDIHYMIRLVAKMVEECGGQDGLVNSKTVPKIPHQSQNKVIRKAAGEFMESIRTLPRVGQELAQIIAAFGKVAHSYLLFATSSNECGNPPHQASRIEPYTVLNLSDSAQKNLKELERYSVLIRDPRGKSRRGDVVPRFYLRRYLIPHFRLTFSQRDSLQLENDQLEDLLCRPKKFEKTMELRSELDARQRGRNSNQKDLFEDG